MEYVHETEMTVRDYECDIQGIVNNAVYQNYLEHARHEFLLDIGINFPRLCEEGIHPVVAHIELDYKHSLRPGDRFVVKVGMHKQGRVRFVFDQAIHRKADDQLVMQAKVTGVITRDGRPIPPDLFDEAFKAKGWTFEEE